MSTCPHCGTAKLDDGHTFCFKCGGSYSGVTGQLSPDTVLEGRYIIVKTLGRGGMGAVYQALDQRLNNSIVAIKEMSTNAVGPGNIQAAIAAFKTEATMLISLRHQALPRITDFFAKGEDRWYLVMDYIEGTTLKQTAQERGKIPEAEVRNWAKQLCDILNFLHTRKPPVIFRDLKPANIMLTPDGVIKLIDFGIARHFRQGQTADTSAYGSAGFAPPEQYGQNQTDARSDIFALGATLHYLLTGIDPEKTPFTFDPPSKTVSISPEFEAVLMKMVDLRAANRPGSIREVAQELANIDVKPTTMEKAQPEKKEAVEADKAGVTAKGSMDSGLSATVPVFMPEVEEDEGSDAVQPVEPVVAETAVLDETAVTMAEAGVEEANVTQSIQPEWEMIVSGNSSVDATVGLTEKPRFEEKQEHQLFQIHEKWRFETGGAIFSSPAIFDGIAYFGSNDGCFYAVDLKTGQDKWKFKTLSPIQSSPVISDGAAYFCANDGYLYAVDIKSGQEKWKFGTVRPINSTPVVSDGVAYFGSDDFFLYAVNTKTKQQKWEFKTGGPIKSSPAISEGVIYFGSNYEFYALDIESGHEKWRFETRGIIFSSPAIFDGVAYFGSNDSYFYAVDIKTKQQKWGFKTGGPIKSCPVILDGVAYFGSRDGRFYAVDLKTEQEKWNFKTKGLIHSSPVISDGVAYFGSEDYCLYAVDITDGKAKWKFETGGGVTTSPAIVNDIAYFGNRDKYLYAVDIKPTLIIKSNDALNQRLNQIFEKM
jgi:outer membrane protein assembly factor BamB